MFSRGSAPLLFYPICSHMSVLGVTYMCQGANHTILGYKYHFESKDAYVFGLIQNTRA